MKLLTLNQVKMLKSKKLGYLSAILNLAPAYQHKDRNTCPMAGSCKGLCLAQSGRNRFDLAYNSRVRKTKLYYDEPNIFYSELIADINACIRKASRESVLLTIRLNGLSDIAFESDNVLGTGKNILELFPDIQFIDYTKRYTRLFNSHLPKNYHLTYSINERTPAEIVKSIYKETRFNCAAVFSHVPDQWVFDETNFQILNGDESDLRHLDERGKVVGLKYKLSFHRKTRKAIRPKKTGFVIMNHVDK